MAESISRPADDPYWNYMRFFDSIQPFVWMKPIDDAHFECVYLSGHPALTISNSNEPPGSFHSRDVFTPHPTLHGRWKHVTRLDDRITLVNGEKVLPLPMEGHIKQNPLVEDAVVVGIGKAAPGLLVFRSQGSKGISDEEYKRSIWPTVEEANARAEQFSQISRDMVAVLPLTAECPTSDKGSMIRDQVYQQYADTIEELYTASTQAAGQLELDRSGTESHLMKLCRDEIGVSIPSPGADFYTEGLDSLNAIHLRRLILRDFKIENSKAIGMNIVFEAGNVSRLAKRIRDIQNGQATTAEDELAIMANLVEKYSSFERHIPGPEPATAKRSIVSFMPSQ